MLKISDTDFDRGHVAERSRRDGCQRNQDKVGVLSVQMHVDKERRSVIQLQGNYIFVYGICLGVSLIIICKLHVLLSI